MIERDKLHYNTTKIDGYNLPFNFIISEREAGKSTAIVLDKIYKAFIKSGLPSIVVRRKIVHITSVYIDDLAKILHKFVDEKIKFKYSKSDIKSGIVDVFIEDKLFIRVIALSIDMTAYKSLLLKCAYIVYDEYICNTRLGEKYLKNEAFRFLELRKTFLRENLNLKCYFMGNPYSKYTPYHMYFGIDTNKLKSGVILTDKTRYVIEAYKLTDELKAHILANDPLYKFSDDYTKYSFDGVSINDANIMIADKPQNFSLWAVFKVADKMIGIYKNNDVTNLDYIFYVEFINFDISKKRDIYVFDFADMENNTQLYCNSDRFKFEKFKIAMRNRNIAFQNIECYYLIEDIYYNI